MNFIPTDKFDFDSCSNLFRTSDNEVILHRDELLYWLQDYNWPVAPLVEKRLLRVADQMVDSVILILQGHDEIWKYWILSSFLTQVEISVLKKINPELKRISIEPTKSEISEGLHVKANILLDKLNSE